jgi:aminodeoxyfutalosine synthase
MAGATTPQQQTVAALEQAIREAGRDPVQRDSHYRRVTPSKDGSMPGVRSAEAELTCV